MSYLEIAPASADRKDWTKLEPLFEDDQWVVEEKLDGWRFLMHVGGKLDRMYLTGRRVSVKTDKFSEKGLCAPMLAPDPDRKAGGFSFPLDYTVIDGEVMPPEGAGFRDLAGIMNAEPAKAAARIKEIGPPEYHAFDLLYLDGVDVRSKPWSWRKRELHALLCKHWARNSRVWMVDHHEKDKLACYERWVAEGGEGAILKDVNAPYGDGWIKVKRFHTLDVVVTGFTEAKYGITGKYDGLIGAVVVSVYKTGKLVEVGQVSGMNDTDRRAFTKSKKQLLGTVMEIKAQELAKDRLRHPRFSRLRPDLGAARCTWTKMEADLKAQK